MRRTTPASIFTHVAQWFGPGIQVRHRRDGAPWAMTWCAPRPRSPHPVIYDELSRRVTTRRRAAIYAAQRGRQSSSGTLGIAVEGLLSHHDASHATRELLIANGYTPRQARQLCRMARKERAYGTR